MITFEEGKEQLRKLSAQAQGRSRLPDENEASVRFHIIDILLTDVLGWNRDDIEVEEHRSGEFTDYEVGKPRDVVIEAKRASHDFPAPAGSGKRPISLKALKGQAHATFDAVEQTLRYCKDRGIQYGVVTNGQQFLCFLGSRIDATPPDEGRAIYFGSLDNAYERFDEFWNLLSRSGIAEGNLLKCLSGEIDPPPPEKLSRKIPQYPGYKNRNPEATELNILGGLFIEDITRDPHIETDFLTKTYCSSGALSQYALVSKEILRARYASVFEQAGKVSASPANTKKGLNPELYHDVIAASMGKRPILLVGDVGSGKSMFMRRLIKVEAKDQLERSFVLYIDFGVKPALADNIRQYAVSEIQRQMVENYLVDVNESKFIRNVYFVELKRFARGLYSEIRESDPIRYREKEIEHLERLTQDPESHLQKALSYVTKNQKKPVIIFLDNVDQRPTEFQEQVFLIAQSIASEWPVTTFVALRPETFVHSKRRGSLSAYQPRVFTIDPPRVDQVIAIRLKFAREQLEFSSRFPWMPTGARVDSSTLTGYIRMLEEAFQKNHKLIEFIDNMSGGNVRLALDMVTRFVGSGHVDSRKIIYAIRNQGGYTLPLHEFLRAVIFGDSEYYEATRSPIANVFDVMSFDKREHFLFLICIGYIEQFGHIGATEGYVLKQQVYGYLQNLGYNIRQIDSVLQRAHSKRLISSPADQETSDASKLRITSAGAYTKSVLTAEFSYVDAMITDTPILAPSYRCKIVDAHLLDERLHRVEIFIEYLDSCWKHVPEEAKNAFDWVVLRRILTDNMRRIAGTT